MMSTSELKKTIQNKEITLLKKADFLSLKPELKHLKVAELRDHFKITHIVDGKFKDMRGHCFGCLASLRHDYTSNLNKNYCLDCL
jgi:hypothetical protein